MRSEGCYKVGFIFEQEILFAVRNEYKGLCKNVYLVSFALNLKITLYVYLFIVYLEMWFNSLREKNSPQK